MGPGSRGFLALQMKIKTETNVLNLPPLQKYNVFDLESRPSVRGKANGHNAVCRNMTSIFKRNCFEGKYFYSGCRGHKTEQLVKLLVCLFHRK